MRRNIGFHALNLGIERERTVSRSVDMVGCCGESGVGTPMPRFIQIESVYRTIQRAGSASIEERFKTKIESKLEDSREHFDLLLNGSRCEAQGGIQKTGSANYCRIC